MKQPITVYVRTVDGINRSRRFKTLKGAQRFAASRVGARPDFGSTYAVSDDGIVTVSARGATLDELFPEVNGPEGEAPEVLP